ncbi:hypothetical protein SH139x_005311 [Planctomycetaceae bacterium SH139]
MRKNFNDQRQNLTLHLGFIASVIVACAMPLLIFTFHFASYGDRTLLDAFWLVLADYSWFFGNQWEVACISFVLFAAIFRFVPRELRAAAVLVTLMANALAGWFLIIVRGEGGLTY